MKTNKIPLPKLPYSPNFAKRGDLWIPKFPIHTNSNTVIDKQVGTYVEYQDLFGKTQYKENSPAILIEEIKSFDFRDLLLSLSKLNLLMFGKYHSSSPTEYNLLKPLFPAMSIEGHQLVFASVLKRKLLFRQQLLALIKMNMLANNYKKGKQLVGANLYGFGRTLFRINDFLDADTTSLQKASQTVAESNEIMFGSMIRNVEMNSTQQFRYVLTRYWTLYFECSKKITANKYQINKRFKQITKINLEHFMLLMFVIQGHYMQANEIITKNPQEYIIGKKFFRHLTKKAKREARRIFNVISATKSQFKKEFYKYERGAVSYYNFQPFWRKPFFKLSPDAYFMLDLVYAQEKVTHGIYGTIIDFLLDKENKAQEKIKKRYKKERNSLNTFDGRCLEIYVNDLLHRVYDNTLSKRLFSAIDDDETGGTDFIIYYPDTLIFIEVTATSLRHNTVFTADISKIDAEIKKLFFSSPDRDSKGKIYQLDDSIKLVMSKKIDLGIDIKTIKNIIPVLITKKGLPILPSLVDRYKSFITQLKLLDKHIDNIQFIDIEELEILEPMLKNGKTLSDIFWEKSASEYRDWPLKNYLLFNEKALLEHNKFLMKQLDKFSDKAVKALFNKNERKNLRGELLNV